LFEESGLFTDGEFVEESWCNRRDYGELKGEIESLYTEQPKNG